VADNDGENQHLADAII